MPSPKTQPARGMRDFLPADVRKREYVIGVIKQVYERYGFEPLETPAVENIETLMGKYGEEGNQLIFKILKRGEHEKTGEADLALRYDLTVPLARVVAQYQNDLPKFFKRYQIQPVWRADRPARGRFREFYQCDVDVLGSQSMVVEAELIAAASEALVALGFKDFTVRVNHRQVLTGILDQAGVAREKHDDALVALDKMDKAGPEGVARELRERGIVDESAVKLMRFFEGLGGAQRALDLVDLGEAADARAAYNADVLGRLVEFIGAHEIGASGVDDLRQVLQLAKASGVDSRIKLDPTLARGLAYYTGAIIEINVADLAGSLGGGGRYDNLVGMFLGKDVPACGFSLGLERIIVVMSEREMFPAAIVRETCDVLVATVGEDYLADTIPLAKELRDTGLRVLLYPDASQKLQKQLAYASNLKVPVVAVIGQQEHEQNRVLVKDMNERTQEHVDKTSAVQVINESLQRGRATIGIDQLQRNLKDSLDKVETKVSEIGIVRASSYSELLQQAEKLATSQQKLEEARANVGAPRWGEIQLERVVELAGLTDRCDFIAQQASELRLIRPDVVVHLPGNRTIVIEGKISLNSFVESLSATDETTRRHKIADQARDIRGHIETLSQRTYLETVQPTPEFVLLFLSLETAFREIIEVDPAIIEDGISHRVIVATPTTLIALLRTIAFTWKQEDLARKADEVGKLGVLLYDRVTAFAHQIGDQVN